MAITDGLICQIYPVAGETAIKNIVNGTLFTGTGTPALVDEAAEKAWAVTAGTLLESAIPSKTPSSNVAGSGVTIAIRFKPTANGSGADFLSIIGVKPGAASVDTGTRVSRAGDGVFRGRSDNQLNVSLSGFNLNTVYTLVYKIELSPVAAADFGKLWRNMVGRIGAVADASSSAADYSINRTLNRAFVNCQSGVAFTLLDFAYWDRELTDTECASVADNYRLVMPAPSSGTAPTGTVTIGTITPSSTGASVPFTYDAADQTGFEYQLNETGTIYPIAASPATPTGLTTSTPYTIRARAVNASGEGEWSTSEPFTTAAGGDTTPPTFTVAPAVTSITQTGGTATAEIDETGSIFYVIVPQAESTPSVAQVIAGQNASGTAPIDFGSAVGTTTLSDAFTGLTAGAAYKACFAARDDEPTPNVQSSVTVVNFNAAAAPVGTITITDIANNIDTPWISSAVDIATIMPMSLGSVVVNKTGLSTTAGADLVITDAAITTGTEYIILLKIGTAYGWYRAVAT